MSKYQDTDHLSEGVMWVDDDPKMHYITSDAGQYTIGELARKYNVTLRTLRFYENKGLLKPYRDGRARLYGQEDRDRLALILQGKRLGFTLSEIAAMIAAHNGRAGPVTLHLGRERCLEQIRLLERQKREIEAALAELRRNYTSLYTNRADSDRTSL